MLRQSVSSSNLASIGYDSVSHTLEVEFTNGSVYVYSSVPESIHRGLMAAHSHGSYFDAYIKKGGYHYRRIR